MTDKPRIICLMGPTAAGKTDLAIALHQRLGAEIISVDSALIYRGMDIGTAKPSTVELALAPHRLIDIRDPAQPYSAADFQRDALSAIQEIHRAGKTPLLVGGTMLYFKALQEGLSPIPPVDPQIRAAIEAEAAERGWPAMHQQLALLDPATAARLHPNHSQRISRALEVVRATGTPLSDWQTTAGKSLREDFHWIQIAVTPWDRQVLHQRIAQRFDKMLEMGFIEEVAKLYQRQDLHLDLPSMRAVGYRQVWEYLAGESTADDMRAKGIAATRQLAKRQLTWLRSWPDLCMVETLDTKGKPLPFHEILVKVLNFL
jgi:tRNA dimethylallyltransferase